MRVLYLIGQFGIGGSERQLALLLSTLAKKGISAGLFVWNHNDSEDFIKEVGSHGVPILSMPLQGRGFVHRILAFRRAVRTYQPDIIHSYSSYLNPVAYIATIFSKTMSVGSMRSSIANTFREHRSPLHIRLSLMIPRHQIFNSQNALSELKRFLPVLRPEVAVIPNGIDVNLFQPSDSASARSYDVVSVGTMREAKNWHILTECTKLLKQWKSNIQVAIAGDGRLRGEVESNVVQNNLSENIVLLGRIEPVKVPEFLRSGRVYLHTADEEGFPNAVAEAMATGLPVVVTAAGDIPLIVDEGINGFVVQKRDAEALAIRLIELLSNEVLRTKMGKAAREKVVQSYGVNRMVDDTLATYQKVLAGNTICCSNR